MELVIWSKSWSRIMIDDDTRDDVVLWKKKTPLSQQEEGAGGAGRAWKEIGRGAGRTWRVICSSQFARKHGAPLISKAQGIVISRSYGGGIPHERELGLHCTQHIDCECRTQGLVRRACHGLSNRVRPSGGTVCKKNMRTISC